MKCHYEVLDVPLDVNNEDLKKAYRKAAFKWHPDKNLDNPDHAKEQFQIVQQAYEVLADPHERAWYDSHRDAILKGGLGSDYKDDSFNVFPFFSSSCFKGYDDEEKGFYSVYREVFNKIAAEESEFMKDGDSDFEIPQFGKLTSGFKDVVQPFYSYWQNFTTKKSFSWLDQYDIRDLPNRRIAKLAEKDNKKIRDKARKDRNETIRNLVAFVYKRDKRVKMHAKVVEEQIAEKGRLLKEKQRERLKKRQEELKNAKQCEWSKFSNFEGELRNIEKYLQAEYGDTDASSSSDNDQNSEGDQNESNDDFGDVEALYCPACQKLFKTLKAFANHENSKKHKENLDRLKQTLLEEDACMEGDDAELENKEDIGEEDEYVEEEEDIDLEDGDYVGSEKGKDGHEDSDTGEIEAVGKFCNEADECHSKFINSKKVENTILNDEPKDGSCFQISNVSSNAEDSEESDHFSSPAKSKKKNQRQKKHKVLQAPEDDNNGEGDNDFMYSMMSKKQRRKMGQEQLILKKLNSKAEADNGQTQSFTENEIENATEIIDKESSHKSKGKKAKEARKLKRIIQPSTDQDPLLASKSTIVQSNKLCNEAKRSDSFGVDAEHRCVKCSVAFPSKNKLFEHLKKTGHSVYVPKNNDGEVFKSAIDKKSGKGRKK